MCFELFRSGSDIEGQLLPQDRNPSEMDTSENLRKKIQELEKKTLDLTNQHNNDVRILFACFLYFTLEMNVSCFPKCNLFP